MQSQDVQSFLEKAQDSLAGIRGGLLLFAQGKASASELMPSCAKLARFQFDAESVGLANVGRIASEAAYSIEHLSKAPGEAKLLVNQILDLLAELEAELLQSPLSSDDLLEDIDNLVEASFANLADDGEEEIAEEAFEIDDETLEIFRDEAESVLASINVNLDKLRVKPDDSNALWEIRRGAHTLKGAAGIVGLTRASEIAHELEDRLDKIVSAGAPANEKLIESIYRAAVCLDETTRGKTDGDTAEVIEPAEAFETPVPAIHRPPTPVVRVSLDRLDALLRLSNEMLAGLDVARAEFPLELLAAQFRLAQEIKQGLQQIRMVRFGVLEMRLNRAVHVTCLDENKKAEVVIETPDVEIDTLVIDALIEPLLHLLKNAVVHGIESPETRRLLGKPEKGRIRVNIGVEANDVVLSIKDDGCGISTARLIEKAIASGIIDEDRAARLSDSETNNLIFERGLTTAKTLNMNAGRGVGMSIVKDSVESRGGSVSITSEPQQGTCFMLRFPIVPVDKNDGVPVVLVVDDSDSIRRLTVKLVEEAGLRPISAVNGADALELLLSGKWEPNLILSDVEMPVMDGWALLEYVKTDENLGHVPVVMITSLDADVHKQRAFELGAADYLVKPFAIEDLRKVLELATVNAAADGSV